jgi:hypothetical protein
MAPARLPGDVVALENQNICDPTGEKISDSGFPKNTSSLAAESQSTHPWVKISKAGQRFFQIPRHAGGPWHAANEDDA